uniref:N-acetyltransferase domain-containing protein n=1 Tax=Thermosporothrix sp. COM3 TaxID=2490863 RepID=A0A455SRX9_9CHLR|nr:hypothetical protein KTC_59080 [Thermosporothrix sp. COM3]
MENLPAHWTIRPVTLADAAAVTKLIQRSELARLGETDTIQDEIEAWWRRHEASLEQNSWLVKTENDTLAGVALLYDRKYGVLEFEVFVAPELVETGLETYLLHLCEKRAGELVPLAPEGAKVALHAWFDREDSARWELLEQHGYAPGRYFWQMGIQLKEQPSAPQWADGITVRTLTPGMERAIFEAKEEAFKDHWGHTPTTFEEWVQHTFQRKNMDPSLWFLAMDGDEIAGLALCSDETPYDQGGWVNVLGVRRPWRRKSIGLALLHQAFGEFYQRGISDVYLNVDARSLTGATRLYERAGMRKVKEYVMMEMLLRDGIDLTVQRLEDEN